MMETWALPERAVQGLALTGLLGAGKTTLGRALPPCPLCLCWLVSSSARSQAPLPPPGGSVILARRDPVSRGLSQALSTACERG